MMLDVMFYEAFEEEAAALKRCLGQGARAGFTWKTIQETGDAAPRAGLISIRTQSAIPLEWAGDLRGILSRSTGYDHVKAYREAVGRGVACGYLPLYCHRAVAEQAALMWMALLRRLPRQTRNFRTFHRDGITGRECEGKVLLVVGVGNIGYEVARIGRGLDMVVLGVDIVTKRDDVEYVEIDSGLPRADVVVCAMDLNETNVGYFDRERLGRMKRGSVFVNVARGELSPSAALLRALESGALGGVGLDVFNEEKALAGALRDGEPADTDEVRAAIALSHRDDAILTPHNAFNTRESVERKAEQSVEQVRSFLETGEFVWEVPG